MTHLPRARFVLSSIALGAMAYAMHRLVGGPHRARLVSDAASVEIRRSSGTMDVEPLPYQERGTMAEAAADRRIALAALELLERDADLDDQVFTPPAAMSLCVDPSPIPTADDRRGDVFGGIS